jgi:hypothetical protein
MPRVQPRSLTEILSQLDRKPITKALAEEAIAAVAADGVASRSEVDALDGYANGVYDSRKQQAEDQPGWKHGTEAGKALLNGLATYVRDLTDNPRSEKVSTPLDPFSLWTGGWMFAGSHDGAKLDPAKLATEVRKTSTGWVHNSVDTLLRQYPKSTDAFHTQMLRPKPEVQAAIDALVKDWVDGKVGDGPHLSDSLKPLLEAKYR